jgi:hypothetical protein
VKENEAKNALFSEKVWVFGEIEVFLQLLFDEKQINSN